MNSKLDKISRESYVKEFQTIPYDYCEGTWLPSDYSDVKEVIENFEIRDDDIWLCGFPKTGTTWTQEMIWCIANNLDFEGATKTLRFRFPSLERAYTTTLNCMIRRKNHRSSLLTIQQIEQLPSPRFIKSHLPYHMLPKQLIECKTNAKIICISRNPKDTCLSSYYFYRSLEGYCGTFENFCELFLGDRVIYSPFWKNILGYRKHKDLNSILFLKYEDMKKDLRSIIRKTASFLNKPLSDNQVHVLENHLSFESMKSNPAVNYEKEMERFKDCNLSNGCKIEQFMRKGERDQWKTEMSDDLIKKFDDWSNRNLDEYPELKHEFL